MKNDYIERYLNDAKNILKQKTLVETQNLLERIEHCFPSKMFAEYNKQDMISILTKFCDESNLTSAATFYSVKCRITQFFEWLLQQNLMTNKQIKVWDDINFKDVDHSPAFLRTCFADFNEVYTTFNDALEGLTGDPFSHAYATLRCAVYLSWYGFQIEELCEIKKKDVDQINGTIYCDTTGKTVRVDRICLQFIVDYMNTDSYTVTGSEKTRTYKNGEYLLRSYMNPKMSYNNVSQLPKKLNKIANENGLEKEFVLSKIYESGLYFRTYRDERDNEPITSSDIERIMTLSQINEEKIGKPTKLTKVSRFYAQYQAYKDAFYPQN